MPLSFCSCTLFCTLDQASELFPTEMRGVAHGFSAAVGKLGALAADITLGVVGGLIVLSFCFKSTNTVWVVDRDIDVLTPCQTCKCVICGARLLYLVLTAGV